MLFYQHQRSKNGFAIFYTIMYAREVVYTLRTPITTFKGFLVFNFTF